MQAQFKSLAVTACFSILCCCAAAQSNRKPGLYEVTTTMNPGASSAPSAAQTPQLPPGVQLPPGMHMPAGMGGPHTSEVCVTQAMIDKYNGPAPSAHHGDCQITEVSKSLTGTTAKLSCTGQMTGTGTFKATWTGPDTIESTVHMVGTAQMDSGSHPVDMTVQSTSVYKGPDCGSVKPLAMPAS